MEGVQKEEEAVFAPVTEDALASRYGLLEDPVGKKVLPCVAVLHRELFSTKSVLPYSHVGRSGQSAH